MSLRPSVLLGLALLACLSAGITMTLLARGSVVFRFGTMSAGFFCGSLAAISIALALALAVCRVGSARPLVDLVSLSGVRSLAIVPLHYLYRSLLILVMGPIATLQAYLGMILTGLVACFSASAAIRWLARSLQAAGRSQGGRRLTWSAVAIGAWALWNGSLAAPYESIVRSVCQLGVCLLFVLSPATSARAALRRDALGGECDPSGRESVPPEDGAGVGASGHPGVAGEPAAGVARGAGRPGLASGGELLLGQADGEGAGRDVDLDDVAVADEGDRAAHGRLGADVAD
jgi:hypothetical protein